jgi:transcriptional regulator with XRE-family HTH domain
MSSKKTKLARLQKPAMGTKHLRAASAASAQRRALDTSNLATGSGAPTPGKRTLERAIGAQIRELRRQLHLSVANLAAAASISAGMLSKIENGQISPSLSTLQALSSALNVPLTALFSTFEDKRDCSFVRRGQGVVIERRGTKAGHVYQLLGHALGGEIVVEPYLITLREEAAPYTSFRHEGAEFIYMLSGEVIYRHADRTYHLKPGDGLMFDPGALHGPEELLVRPMTFLSIIIYKKPQA